MNARSATNKNIPTRGVSVSAREKIPDSSVLKSDQGLSLFLQKAAAVLEQELKLPISASEPVLGRVTSSGSRVNTIATAEQVRQQAHQLIDDFIQLLEYRPEQLGQFLWHLGRVGSPRNHENRQFVPFLKPPPPVNSGQSASILLTLENDELDETIDCGLYTTDFVGGLGGRIPPSEINIFPQAVQITAGESIDVRVEIRVPTGTPPGLYTGLLIYDGGFEQAVIQFSVNA